MQPIVKLFYVEANPPSLGDNTGDIDRLKKIALTIESGKDFFIPFRQISTVAHNFRNCGFKGWLVANDLPCGYEIVDFLAQVPSAVVGMALDLGTTHLEASLVNLLDGTIMARANLENSQIK